MPLVQIDLDREVAGRADAINAVVQQSLIDALGVPLDDKFQVVRPRERAELVSEPNYGGVERGTTASVQRTRVRGYKGDQKRALFRMIAERAEAVGFRHEDLLISLLENGDGELVRGRRDMILASERCEVAGSADARGLVSCPVQLGG